MTELEKEMIKNDIPLYNPLDNNIQDREMAREKKNSDEMFGNNEKNN